LSYDVYANERVDIGSGEYTNAYTDAWTEQFEIFNNGGEHKATDTFETQVFMFNEATEIITSVGGSKNKNVPIVLPAHMFVDIQFNGALSAGNGSAILSATVSLGTFNGATYDYVPVKVFKFPYADGEDKTVKARYPLLNTQVGKYNIKVDYTIDNALATYTLTNEKDAFFWVSTQGMNYNESDYVPIVEPEIHDQWEEDLATTTLSTNMTSYIYCVDDDGDIYMTDQNKTRMYKYNCDGDVWDENLAKGSTIFYTKAFNDDYIFGVASNDIHIYDKALDTWSYYYPVASDLTPPILVGTKLYMYSRNTNKMIVFDTIAKTIDETSTPKTGGDGNILYHFNGKLFLPNTTDERMDIYDIALDSWSVGASAGYEIDYPATDAYGDYLYFKQGGGNTYMLKYNMSTESWEPRIDIPTAGYTGSPYFMQPQSWYKDGTDAYFQYGGSGKDFVKFDTLTDTFTEGLAEASQNWNDIFAGIVYKGKLYATTTPTNNNELIRYII